MFFFAQVKMIQITFLHKSHWKTSPASCHQELEARLKKNTNAIVAERGRSGQVGLYNMNLERGPSDAMHAQVEGRVLESDAVSAAIDKYRVDRSVDLVRVSDMSWLVSRVVRLDHFRERRRDVKDHGGHVKPNGVSFKVEGNVRLDHTRTNNLQTKVNRHLFTDQGRAGGGGG